MYRFKRNIAMLVAISASLHGFEAMAEETSDVDSSGRTVKDIVIEARSRVGEAGIPPPERREQGMQETETPQPRSIYVGLGHEPHASVPMDAVHRFEESQRAGLPLQYLMPVDPHSDSNAGAWSLFLGRELTNWLDVELSAHAVTSYYQTFSKTPVIDTSLAGNAQDIEAAQYSIFEERTYSLTFLPRWEVKDWLAVYGRLGVGYADNKLEASLQTQGWVSSTRICSTDEAGKETCYNQRAFDAHDWSNVTKKSNGFFPVVGVGVQLLEFLRLEYMLRADVPIVDTTANIWSGLYFSFLVKGAWFRRAR